MNFIWCCCGAEPCQWCSSGTTPTTIRVYNSGYQDRSGVGSDPDPTSSTRILDALMGDHTLTQDETFPCLFEKAFANDTWNSKTIKSDISVVLTSPTIFLFVVTRNLTDSLEYELGRQFSVTSPYDCGTNRTSTTAYGTGQPGNPAYFHESTGTWEVNYSP